MVFDTGSDADEHARERLRNDIIGWLTTVTPDGQPQTFPVWYLWDDGEALIYSDRGARRNVNLRANPRVSLHLNDDGRGGDIISVEGEARIVEHGVPVTANRNYLAKYGAMIVETLGSAQQMAETYSVVIRIRPVRGVHAG
jgi:PPOX class probable F420-dependent enzyme